MPMLALFGLAAVLISGVPSGPTAGVPSGAPAGGPRLWPGTVADAVVGISKRDDGERLRAVLELARVDAARARPLLVSALRDRDAGVRLTAGRLLAGRGAREATAAATAWLGESGPRARVMGLLVLRQATELPEDARRAVEHVLRDGDVTTRLEALELLAAHPSARSSGAVAALLDDELAEVRVRALRALAATADPRVSLAVVRRLSDSDRGVRIEAATTLGALGDRRVVPALLRQLDEASADPRAWVIDALGRLGDPAALPALARLARRSPRDELARHATLALGVLGTPEAVEVLLEVARAPPGADDVRTALVRVGPRAVPRLCREVTATSPTSARLAIEALGELGDRRATPALVAVVQRGGLGRVAALEALARLGDKAALPALVGVATDAEAPELRALALDALVAIGDERALVAVPRALADAAPTVRARAARLAGALGGSPQATALAAHLADEDPGVRGEAARALGRLAAVPPRVVGAVVAALERGVADRATGDALGDALERAVHADDGAALGRAYLAVRSPLAREELARGLAAAHVDAPLEEAAVIEALVADMDADADAELAPFAAEALTNARLPRATAARLGIVFARAESPVRARLADALARVPGGATTLALTLGDARVSLSVRAAAAWALAGRSDARAALERAAASPEPAVAANASAALAAGKEPARRRAWSAVRLTGAEGQGAPGRWLTVSAAGGPPVWVMTDLRGRARVGGLAEGPVVLGLAPAPVRPAPPPVRPATQ